jgi:hypothetical protein
MKHLTARVTREGQLYLSDFYRRLPLVGCALCWHALTAGDSPSLVDEMVGDDYDTERDQTNRKNFLLSISKVS